MAIERFVNELELRKAIQVLKPHNQVFEIRITGQPKTISGYFKDADTLIAELKTIDLRNTNVYITLNQVNEDCFSRMQSEKLMKGKNSTTDTEIDGYQFLFVDLDPQRLSGISSSEEELDAAYVKASKICRYMESIGFESPVKAISGNGAHLLYRINLKNTDENKALVENCLKALAQLFNDEVIQVDTTNFNPSRICKLYGTLAQKGANTEERPHRMSRIFDYPEELKITDRAYLEKLAGELLEEPKPAPSKHNNFNMTEFNIDEWLSSHGIRYTEGTWRDGCRKLILDNCPFDHNHKAPDSMILVQSSGAIGFKCLHNSCRSRTWKDVRVMYEPDAYDSDKYDRRIEEGWKKHNRDKEQGKIIFEPIKEGDGETEPMFQTMSMILARKEPENEYIETGINIIDKKMRGLKKGGISVVSGLRGSAKSTLISNIMLNGIQNGQKTICYSGELSDKNFLKWIMQQAAGKYNVTASDKYEDLYHVNDECKEPITRWMGENLWLYNNRYGSDFNKLSRVLVDKIKQHEADLVVIDNLMTLDLDTFDINKYDAQTKFVRKLKEIAELCNVHIIFVAHPRKAGGFLRLDDIAGSGNISNYVDNAFIVHRRNADFVKLSKMEFGWKDTEPVLQDNVTNVVEVCKDRENGNQDLFIPLYYEKETKRLRNTPTESIIYGWTDGFVKAKDGETPFN